MFQKIQDITMSKIRILIGLVLIIWSQTLFAQQDPQYSQYTYNMNVINPAYAGSKGVLSAGIMGRSQWVGIEGAPRTLTLGLHSPVGKNVGLGFSVIADRIGPVSETNVYADFSYTLKTSEESRLALGIKGGFTSLQVANLFGIDSNDPLNVPIDRTSPNFGVGAYYYTERFYVGLSAPNLLKTRYLEKTGGIVSTASEIVHIFLSSGYVFQIDDDLKFKPSTMIRANNASPISMDISGNLLWQDKVEFGLSYRFNNSLSAILAFMFNDNMRIGYAYDLNISNFGAFSAGSHELMLLIDFNRTKLESPRFF